MISPPILVPTKAVLAICFKSGVPVPPVLVDEVLDGDEVDEFELTADGILVRLDMLELGTGGTPAVFADVG